MDNLTVAHRPHRTDDEFENLTKPHMPKIIGIAQVKGGAGRSTVATNLAGEFSKIGETVLIDADMPQGTAASWYALRQQAGRAQGLAGDTASTHRELVTKVEAHAKKADFIVLDGPPRIAEMTRAMVVLSDLVLVPVGASVAEIWATGDVKMILDEAKTVRPINARMVWTRLRANTRIAKDLGDQAGKELDLKTLKTALALRVAYVEALGAGMTAAETGDRDAKAELQELLVEIRKIIR
jgi:chromosome partitioning protein